MTADYNGWTDAPEDERETLTQAEEQMTHVTVASLAETFGWQRISTGGDCDAFSKPIPGRSDAAYWLITAEGGANIPTDVHSPVHLGAYAADGEAMQIIPATFSSLVEAILSTERR